MKAILLSICVVFITAMPLWAQSKSVVRESVQTVKTYPYSDPNLVADPSLNYYPYFRYDGFAEKGVDAQWKVVEMENDYIKVTLFPEVGGKLWGAVDKTTGKEFIYHNHVVKFRDISMRGPWTSGGIEFNFGIFGHAPTVATPVDYCTKENEDGSVSYFVASYDWVTRTYWNVEVNLPADKAYFTTTTTWYNQSGEEQPYYQWMNAGFKAGGNARFYYPGSNFIGHDGELSPFPVDDEGRDRSWYRNNDFEGDKSEHVLGYYNDFYGVYWHDDDFGAVHHSAYDEKLGMKIFLWPLSRNGSLWEDLLTDTDGQYVELQSGRMFNQPARKSAYSPYKHYSFGPDLTDRWTEYWFPVENIGGISKAGDIGALNVVRDGEALCLAFSPLCDLDTEVHIYDGDREVETLNMKAETLKPWTVTVPFAGSIAEGSLRVVIGDDALVYSERQEDFLLDRPKELPSDFEWDSLYGLYTMGVQWMNQKYNDEAERSFVKALEKDKYFAPALNKLASLYERTGRVAEALELVKTSLALDAYDDEANYVYGLCNLRLGKFADAKDGFSVASRSTAYRSAAYTRLAEIYLRETDYARAERYALLAIKYNSMDLKAKQVLMVTYRKTGRTDDAAAQIDEVLAYLPLYHAARFEKLYGNDGWSGELTDLVQTELPEQTYIEMALWYDAVGCTEEALALLECAGDYPLALYLSAYILNGAGSGAEATELLEKANALPSDGVFPFRPEILESLQWAYEASGDWKTKYYEALVCWANNRPREALDLLASLEPDNAAFYSVRAKLGNQIAKGNPKCLDDLLKAEELGMSWRTGVALLDAYTDAGQWDKVVSTGEKYSKKYPGNYYIGLKLAKGYYKTGDYSRCVKLLDGMVVLPNEGASAGRQTYHDANLSQAIDLLGKGSYKKAQTALDKSLEWPDNLGTGKPFDEMIDTRLENYVQSLILSGLKDESGSVAALEKVVLGKNRKDAGTLLVALALRDLGRSDEADELLASWEESNGLSPYIQWAKAVYNGDKPAAAELYEAHGPTSAFAGSLKELIVKFVRGELGM